MSLMHVTRLWVFKRLS